MSEIPWAGLAPAAWIAREEEHLAHNYHPLPVVLTSGEGAWVTDINGKRYLDCLSAYSAVNFGHSNPVLLDVARRQLERLTLTSRAFHSDQLGPFAAALADLAHKDMLLPMNTGAEAVESGLKVARKWGYKVKGIPQDAAEIITMSGNFHGRTISIITFSDDPSARAHFGPFTPGFVTVPYGDAAALAEAINPSTAAVLLEPIQGEGGIIVPPAGYLQQVRELCTEHNVLMMADEIQSGLGRVGATFQCDNEGVVPDIYLLGKALGGGIVPLSAVVANRDVLGLLRPGEHGSTFGGNPLACAVGLKVIEILKTGEMQERARVLGRRMGNGLRALIGHGLLQVRQVGLWIGADLDPALGTGRHICELMLERGVLAKDTHGSTIRFAPPLVISPEDIDLAVGTLADALATARTERSGAGLEG